MESLNWVAILDEGAKYNKGKDGAYDARSGYGGDATANDRGRIPRQIRGRAGGGGDVEREHVDDGVDNLDELIFCIHSAGTYLHTRRRTATFGLMTGLTGSVVWQQWSV